jgi:drug/metabolite transporter (DMT)-like permease
VAAIALALTASVLWGIGDFLGGVTARRVATVTVVAISQVIGLAAVLVVALVAGGGLESGAAYAAAAAAGVAGAIGLGALYRGMAIGAMGVVAPISASAAAIPVAVGLARGERPSVVQLAGIGVALAGVALVSREPGSTGGLAVGVPLALLAAVGFGLYFVFTDRASADDAFWAVVFARTTSSVLALAVAGLRGAMRVPRARLPALAAIGLFDVAANVALAVALNEGLVSVVSVLASLFPVVTVGLAMVVLRERLGPAQTIGAVGALAGVVLISAG